MYLTYTDTPPLTRFPSLTNIDMKLSRKFSNSNEYLSYLQGLPAESFIFETLTFDDLAILVADFKYASPEYIILGPIVLTIFNTSLIHDITPDCRDTAKMTPVFKNCARNLIRNY